MYNKFGFEVNQHLGIPLLLPDPVVESELDARSYDEDRQYMGGGQVELRRKEELPQGGMIKRFCFPLAATPSSFSMSRSSNFPRASMNPFMLASIREGVMDFGRTTHPFLSAKPNVGENPFSV